jgi:hypothetical protein
MGRHPVAVVILHIKLCYFINEGQNSVGAKHFDHTVC